MQTNSNSCVFYNAVIFDRTNPNYEITDTNEAIEKLFKDKYVVPVVNELEYIIGFVKDVGDWEGNKLHGDILFWNIDDTDLNLINYKVVINIENKNILFVDSITYG